MGEEGGVGRGRPPLSPVRFSVSERLSFALARTLILLTGFFRPSALPSHPLSPPCLRILSCARPQTLETIAQPGSLDSERAIYACAFDQSGSRLITGEADKTIKMWKEDPEATEQSHPVNWEPPRDRKKY